MSTEVDPVATDVPDWPVTEELQQWIDAQLAKAPAWTQERMERLAFTFNRPR